MGGKSTRLDSIEVNACFTHVAGTLSMYLVGAIIKVPIRRTSTDCFLAFGRLDPVSRTIPFASHVPSVYRAVNDRKAAVIDSRADGGTQFCTDRASRRQSQGLRVPINGLSTGARSYGNGWWPCLHGALILSSELGEHKTPPYSLDCTVHATAAYPW